MGIIGNPRLGVGGLSEDKISLLNMRFYGYHGVHSFERETGQPFEVDVEARADLAGAGTSDDLARTVDYSRIYELVREVIEGPSRRLVESLAEEVARRVLTLAGITAVTVRVRKPRAPLPGASGLVEVEIRRRRTAGLE